MFDVATFDATFLENVKNMLVEDAEAEAGEDGLSQEEMDEIDGRINEIKNSLDAICPASQNAINAAANANAAPQTNTDPELDPVPHTDTDPEPDPVPQTDTPYVTENDDPQNEGTPTADGDTSLINIGG